MSWGKIAAMLNGKLILSCYWLICILPGYGQCIRGDSLLKMINYLRDSSHLSGLEQTRVLTGYESRINKCEYRNDSTHVLLLHRIGKLYFSEGDYSNAVIYYRKSIDIIKKNAKSPSINLKHLISSYYLISAVFDSWHRVREKMEALDSCAAIAIRLNAVDKYCLWALYKKAEYFFDVGDYHRCIDYASACESFAGEFARKGSKQDSSDGIHYANSSFIWNVNALLVLRNYDQAERMLVAKAEERKIEGLKNDLGVIYGLLAEVLVFKRDYDKAVLYNNLAFTLEEKSGSAFNCKAILNATGFDIYFKHYQDIEKAIAFFRKALNYKVIGNAYQVLNSLESLSILNRIGNVFVQKGQYDSASKYMQLALDQISPGISEADLLHNSLDEFIRLRRIGYIATLIVDKAEAFHKKYNATGDTHSIREAIRIYKIADQFLERIKSEQADVKSKLFWREDRRRLYERAIEACFADGNTIGAFYFFERSRAVLLYDQLNQQRHSGAGDILLQSQLKKRLVQLEAELNKKDNTTARARELQKELINSSQELDQLNNVIKARNPLYFQSFLDSGHITLQDMQRFLKQNNENLVEFFEGDSAIYSIKLAGDQVYFEKIDKNSFDNKVKEFVSYISDRSLLNRNFNDFISTSYQLYQLLFQNHPLPPGKVIVSPDGHHFPVEALISQKSSRPEYFIQTHWVSYIPSARFLMIDFNTTPDNDSRDFMGIAPVYFNKGLSKSSLIGSDISLQTVRSNFRNADCSLFEDASKEKFLQKFSDYQVIQLYTHASDKKTIGEPEIYFADSVLYLSDLSTEKKPFTKLIVLSACETGTGEWYRGEGVFSFSRGFAALGIPSSVTNLWSVDNKSTYRLTELFYKYLAKGLEMDIALQKAKLEFIETGTNEERMPFYWSATILAGKTDAIQFKKPLTLQTRLIYLGIILLAITASILWISYKKNRILKA